MTAISRVQAAGMAQAATVDFRPPLSVAVYMHDLAGGGVERQSLGLAKEFRDLGIDVTLVVHQSRGELLQQIPDWLPVVDLKSRRTVTGVLPLARYIRTARPQVLLANLDHNNIAALMAKALAGTQTKVVITQHNPILSDPPPYDDWTYRLIPRAYFVMSPFISCAVAVSRGIQHELRTHARLPAHKVELINNPVITGNFVERSSRNLKHRWFGDPSHKLFVTAGRLVPQKDYGTLLRAFAIHRQRMQSRMLILGTGPMREQLEALAVTLGIQDVVEFMGFQENPLPAFRNADAFVLSSRTEGFGNVLVEAMGCGTPVIATNCPHGPAEILENGRFGMLVQPSDPNALAAAMDQINSLRNRYPNLILQARASDFTYAACAQNYLNLFRRLIRDKAEPA